MQRKKQKRQTEEKEEEKKGEEKGRKEKVFLTPFPGLIQQLAASTGAYQPGHPTNFFWKGVQIQIFTICMHEPDV